MSPLRFVTVVVYVGTMGATFAALGEIVPRELRALAGGAS